MKAPELRIGNWINEKGKLKQVYSVSNHNAKDYSKLKPTPLTEEWLLKFGFEKDECEFSNTEWSKYVPHASMSFYETENGYQRLFDDHYDVGIEIKYVHQLQNLYFALVGEELTIKE